MQELLSKIEASATARLTVPPGRASSKELARYKGFLKVETHRLKILHRAGAGGLHICQARAAMLDQVLRHLWVNARNSLSDQARKEFPSLALAAIGGYGRGELNPHSDIDFMFLHDGQIAANQPLPLFARMIDGLLYPLWDMGLKIGHSVRSVEDCVKVANSDMQSKTSMIEARLITGDEDLFKRFEKTVLKKCVQGHEEEYIEMRVRDQAARRAKFGNSACMQEPNVKNGCGGLRDFQNLLWMTFFKHRTRSLRDLETEKMISDAERKQLAAAYDFILRVRTEMHYHVNRPTDVLGKAIQPAVAFNLGYRERSPSKRIEEFMGDFYSHSRNVFLITRTVEQRLALLPEQPRRFLAAWLPGRRTPPVNEVIDGFKIAGGEIIAQTPDAFTQEPRRLMRVFLYAQRRGLRLHADLAQSIRNQLRVINARFMADAHVRETFLAILNERGNVAPVLRAMHDTGLLGKYLPEFGKLTCLVQHEFYHQYTADEHTLVCIEQLDKLWKPADAASKSYAELFHQLERPFILYLALLLHDVGKSDGKGEHSTHSTKLAMRVARRLCLDAPATNSLQIIIEHHLLLASVSQRRDLDDPAVIRQVARQVQTVENLCLLTIHTFVDTLATSDKLWNGFKDSLLWSLFHKTKLFLSGGADSARAEDRIRDTLKQEVQQSLPATLSVEELDAHFATLPARYFAIHTAREVVEHLQLANRFMRLQVSESESGLDPIISWRDDPDRGCSHVHVCTWDRAGLFSKIAGSFSAAALSILSAQIFSRSDGIALDDFYVIDAKGGGGPGQQAERELFEQVLNKALNGAEVDFRALINRQKNARPLYQAYLGERIPTRISWDNESSGHRTRLEVETEDRVGLLYVISQAFAELALDISGAKIFTEKGAAIDSFFIRELTGEKVVRPERQQAIAHRLRQAILSLDVP